MSLKITGFEVDHQHASWKRNTVEKKASLLSRELACLQQRPFIYDHCTTEEDEFDDEYTEDECCHSDEPEQTGSHSSSGSMPIPRPRSRVAQMFRYARFQLHVQQAHLQEMQQQHALGAMMQQGKVVYGQPAMERHS